MEKTTMSVQELSAHMGISLPKAYELVKTPGFPTIRVGTRILIPVEAYGEGARKSLVNERMKILDLQTEYGRYEERKRIANEITDLFSGTDYEALISQIVDMVISTDKPKILYLTSLKSFGKKDGTEVYRKIKNSAISV